MWYDNKYIYFKGGSLYMCNGSSLEKKLEKGSSSDAQRDNGGGNGWLWRKL